MASLNFAAEMSRILPLMLREVARRQKGLFTKGSLSLPHIVVLDMLSEKGGCTMGELAAMLELTMGAATAVVDKMVSMGLVKRERSKKDRRVVRVSLLKKGGGTIDRLNGFRKAMVTDMYKAFTEEEKSEYLRLLRKVVASFEREG